MKSIILAVVLVFLLTGVSPASDPASVSGTYISKQDSKEYLTLSTDGSFHLKQRKRPPDPDHPFIEITGTFQASGDTITLKLPDGGEGSGTLKGNTFEDKDGASWVKEGSEQPKGMERPKRVKW